MGRIATAGAALALALMIAGCASPDVSLTDRIAGSRVHGDADRVTVLQAASAADAFPLAIGHCGHFKRSARYDHKEGDAYVFRCVQP